MNQTTWDEIIKEATEKGLDLHKLVASKMYEVGYNEVTTEQRIMAKELNFMNMYGPAHIGDIKE